MKTLTSDKNLRAAVMAELEWDPKIDPTHIGVSAASGAITLTGSVASYPQECAAVRAAERVYGVSAVADELEVRLPTPFARDDAAIAGEIAHERKWHTTIPVTVDAEVKDGYVTLRGEVELNFERDDAADAVRSLAGVRGITNLITVRPRVQPNPPEVEQRVEDAIERMADLDARSVWVTSQNGTVHLHGHVHSLAESRIAQRAAEAAPGVARVENDLVVRP